MIGLMPFTGAVESAPTVEAVGWASMTSNGTTLTGSISTIPGALYVLVTAGSDASTYMNTPSGWTLGYRSGNITFHYVVATANTISVVVGKTGTGSFSSPRIYVIKNYKSEAPGITGAVTGSSVTSRSITVAVPEKNSVVISALWLAANNTVTFSSSVGNAQKSTTFGSATVAAGKIDTFYEAKVGVGNYTFNTNWTGATSARLALYTIR